MPVAAFRIVAPEIGRFDIQQMNADRARMPFLDHLLARLLLLRLRAFQLEGRKPRRIRPSRMAP